MLLGIGLTDLGQKFHEADGVEVRADVALLVGLVKRDVVVADLVEDAVGDDGVLRANQKAHDDAAPHIARHQALPRAVEDLLRHAHAVRSGRQRAKTGYDLLRPHHSVGRSRRRSPLRRAGRHALLLAVLRCAALRGAEGAVHHLLRPCLHGAVVDHGLVCARVSLRHHGGKIAVVVRRAAARELDHSVHSFQSLGFRLLCIVVGFRGFVEAVVADAHAEHPDLRGKILAAGIRKGIEKPQRIPEPRQTVARHRPIRDGVRLNFSKIASKVAPCVSFCSSDNSPTYKSV